MEEKKYTTYSAKYDGFQKAQNPHVKYEHSNKSSLESDIAKMKETLVFMEQKVNLILSSLESKTESKYITDEKGMGKVVPKTLLDVWNTKAKTRTVVESYNGRTNK
jgi:hypothetical protein